MYFSVRYFRAMANGEQPPLREDNQSVRLTAGMLKILNRQVDLPVLASITQVCYD